MNEMIEKILKIEEENLKLKGNRNVIINKILKALDEEWKNDTKTDKD